MESFPEDYRTSLRGIARATGFTETELLALDADDLEWWVDTLGV